MLQKSACTLRGSTAKSSSEWSIKLSWFPQFHVLQMRNLSSNPKTLQTTLNAILWIHNVAFKKLWIHKILNHALVFPQNVWKAFWKFCGSTILETEKLWIHKISHQNFVDPQKCKRLRNHSAHAFGLEKRPRGSPRNFFLGFRIWPLFFFMSLGLISRNLLGYKRTHRCDDFHVFSTQKKYWPKKTVPFSE
jgi:hypothetical protein